MFIEIIILLLCPIPGWEYKVQYTYNIDNPNDPKGMTIQVYQWISDYIMLFMLLRLFFVIRAFFNYNLMSDAYSKRLCKVHDLYPGFRFILKTIFVDKPELTVLIMFLCSTSFLAFMLRVAESKFCLHPQTQCK